MYPDDLPTKAVQVLHFKEKLVFSKIWKSESNQNLVSFLQIFIQRFDTASNAILTAICINVWNNKNAWFGQM